MLSSNLGMWLGILCAILAGLIFALSVFLTKLRAEAQVEPGAVTTEWIPTGRIDFYQVSNQFVLQAEDSREVTSIGGLQRKEIRWRLATLDEAKKVVVKFHAAKDKEKEKEGLPFMFQDPAAKSAVTFESDKIARALGAHSTGSTRKLATDELLE